jgi:hypothetical protein
LRVQVKYEFTEGVIMREPMSVIIRDVSKRVIIVKGEKSVKWIEQCNKKKDIIKVKNLHDDVWQVELIKRVGSYYRK